ncbi:GFA family protein [Sphingomonas quercus]|uniref:GFA family protein n=1 Tax=Sphingomonas quercus TaxID=2842451 RepID=A0ABS6BLF7_9SPHN|nr:GFA family protein [Sphingomonas quercus]MBU3078084.1 GFA family protein [Sphingomonas quercus]
MGTDRARLRGSCLCGHVTYRVEDAFEYAMICHCADCRRATGSAFKPFAGIAADRIAVQDDTRLLRYGGDAAHDAHCQRCGSLLYSLVREGSYVHVTLGTLIDDPSIRPTAHIFVASKASWDMICDDLPRFDRFPFDQ